MVRANGDYSLVVVGLTLAGLGIYRLIRTYERKQDSRFLDEDRVLNKLCYHFDANYSVAVDYELPDGQVVPYLVLGPPGVLLFERWDRPGRVEERNGTWRREHEEKVTEHPNPRKKNTERVESVRDLLGENVPVNSLLVVTTRKAERDPLEADDVVHLRNLLDAVRNRTNESSLNWEEVNELEGKLGLGPD